MRYPVSQSRTDELRESTHELKTRSFTLAWEKPPCHRSSNTVHHLSFKPSPDSGAVLTESNGWTPSGVKHIS
jgi:hypothetical protein